MEQTTPDYRAELIQRRVAVFAAMFGGINLVGFVLRSAVLFVWGDEIFFVPNGTIAFQGLAAAGLVGIWVLTRGRRRSLRFVRGVEMGGLLVTSVAYSIVAVLITQTISRSERLADLADDPELRLLVFLAMIIPLITASFLLTYAMVIRAAFVPTSVRYTARLTTLVGLPLPVIGYLVGEGTGELGFTLLDSPVMALGGMAQWTVTIAVCSAISHVIYGLHEEVVEAKRLGQYTLDELIGEGGMGRVFRASHAMLRRPTAVKLLPAERAGTEAIERFEREVQLTSELTHPNTVTIFDYGRTDDGVFYYAMELLEGASLEEIVQLDGPQPIARVIRIIDQVAGALGEAHSIGLIHRDVKPANIVLCKQGGELDVAKVVDFGLVKELDERHGPAVSQEGTISGTPLYMAPEILTGEHGAGPYSDLYALGAVAYFLLTGEHVFTGRSVVEVLGHHLHSEPVPPSVRRGDAIPEELERLVLDCLAKDPKKRPADAGELRRRLDECADAGRWTQRSAKNWWAAHEPMLKARRDRGVKDEGPHPTRTTIVVNLKQRD